MSASSSRRPWRFATFLAPNMLPVYRFLADHLAAWLDHPVQLIVGTSFDQFEQGQARHRRHLWPAVRSACRPATAADGAASRRGARRRPLRGRARGVKSYGRTVRCSQAWPYVP
jgi:predicted metalloprotease with PDZ domain